MQNEEKFKGGLRGLIKYFQTKLELVWNFSDFDQKVGHWKISKDVKLKKKFKLKNNISKPN